MIGRKGHPSTLRQKRREAWVKNYKKTDRVHISRPEHEHNHQYQHAIYKAAIRIWAKLNKK